MAVTNRNSRIGSPPQVRGKRKQFLQNQHNTGITPAGAGKTRTSPNPYGSTEDHPRRCGENSFNGASLQSASGSPPQVRGKRCKHMSRAVYYGITPAGAGKTNRVNVQLLAGWDHPRRCGENLVIGMHSGSSMGSPPQVRGKPSNTPRCHIRSRITPAGAGKTA